MGCGNWAGDPFLQRACRCSHFRGFFLGWPLWLTSSRDTVRLWNTASGQQTQSFAGYGGQFARPAVAPDSRFVLAEGSDKTAALLWDAVTGHQIRSFEGWDALALSQDGRFVLTRSKKLRLWNAVRASRFARSDKIPTCSTPGPSPRTAASCSPAVRTRHGCGTSPPGVSFEPSKMKNQDEAIFGLALWHFLRMAASCSLQVTQRGCGMQHRPSDSLLRWAVKLGQLGGLLAGWPLRAHRKF